MVTLKGKQVFLRAIEPEDLEFIHDIENDEQIWYLSQTKVPYSKYVIKQYLESAQSDLFETKQLRLVISNFKSESIGLIDLFDFDFFNKRAGLGILIKETKDRKKGFGTEALELLINYCFLHLQLHQIYCNVSEDNDASLKLFLNAGFKKVGLKQDWTFKNNTFNNEYLLQLINSNVL
ncbi:GNAT family N-acetyltransferase [Flavobacteriaceae bacterium]|nr:GNAT family N-acetyltransferase [Flavobacteriaceae bacterium]